MIIRQNLELKPYTSLRVGGPAEKLVELESHERLANVVGQLDQPLTILGYGTNCLISDKGLPGNVLLDHRGEIDATGEHSYKVDSGVNWDDFIQRTIDDGSWGLEFTSGIPGGVGAAIVGNIAAYGQKVADRLKSATIYNPQTRKIESWPSQHFKFDYRSSALQEPGNQQLIVLSAEFELSPEPTGELEYDSALKVAEELAIKPDSLHGRRQIIIEARRRAGSLLDDSVKVHHSAGSFFKNPLVNQEQVDKILSFEEQGITKEQLLKQNKLHMGDVTRVPAALVMLAAGFQRGQTWGQVRLHPDHVLKVENLGQATATEIYEVVQRIIKTVKDKLDIDLEPEVRFLGEF